MIEAFKTLFGTMFDEDILITAFAAVTLVAFFMANSRANIIKKDIRKITNEKNLTYAKKLYNWGSRWYTIFASFISIFPLLGMLGTVCGLLGLDLAAGDMENIKANFFIALTSTAWGIIYSVIYKIVHSLVADKIERQIEAIKNVCEELEWKRGE